MKNFISSDIHGFLDEWQNELKKVGFDANNCQHRIILCGDNFDRGKQAKELLDFLLKLPRERLILIRGNHEDLMDDCIEDLKSKQGIHRHHILNGTLDTISQLTGISEWDLRCGVYQYNDIEEKLKPYYELIDRCVNYYEIDNNIFVHGWIPLDRSKVIMRYNPDWRNANELEWKDARWFNGMDMNHLKLQDECATIYCGHWHTSYGHSKYHNKCSEFNEDAIFEPYYDEGIVALDACTAHSGKVNVVVLDDSTGGTT